MSALGRLRPVANPAPSAVARSAFQRRPAVLSIVVSDDKRHAKALADGRPVVIAKLDRISQEVEHIAGLMKRHKFRVATMSTADTLQLHIYAVLAEQERTFISERTKAALKSLEARAVAGDLEAVQKIENCTKALAKGRSMLNRSKGHGYPAPAGRRPCSTGQRHHRTVCTQGGHQSTSRSRLPDRAQHTYRPWRPVVANRCNASNAAPWPGTQ